MSKDNYAEGRGPTQDHDRLNGQPRPKIVLLGATAIVLALGSTLLLYREAIGFPFLFDDMIHLRWLDWHSLPEIWTTAEGLGYYRPLSMSFWKVGDLVQGRYDPALFHTLNLLLHALNGILTGYIAWRAYRGRGRSTFALLAIVLFVVYPFSYQAVPSTSSLSKPLIATLTLGSALLYWEARRRHSKWLLGLSLLVGLLAPLAYETGVMVPVAIVAIELLGHSRQEFERLSWVPALYMILIWGGALPLILLMEPDTGASVSLPTLSRLWQNGVYFVEGLFFPLTPVDTPLEKLLAVDRYLLLAMVELVIGLLLLAFYRWTRQLRLFLYALSWFVVGILPLWLMLDFAYVITSPRILYLGAVGSVLLWAGLPVLLWVKLPERLWPKALAVAGVVLMLGFGTIYVRGKMTLANAIAAPLWEAVRAAEVKAESDSLLYLNVPAWVASKEPIYRVGTEGLTFIPEYVRVQDFAYVNAGEEPEIRAFMFDAAKQDWDAYIGYAGTGLDWEGLASEIRQADGVYLTAYTPDGLRFVKAGALEPPADQMDIGTAPARFEDRILLLDYRIEPWDETSSGGLILDLWWYSAQARDQDITVFVHVYDQQGQLAAQGDGYPLLGLFPPFYWQAEDVVHDIRYITLPDSLEESGYTLVVGWYDPATSQRLEAVDEHGQPVPQDAFPLWP